MHGDRAVTLSDGAILNRYWDDRDTPRDESWLEDVELAQGNRRLYRDLRAAAESGWDFSSRWMADDGGWWLLGLRRADPALLQGVPMSTSTTVPVRSAVSDVTPDGTPRVARPS